MLQGAVAQTSLFDHFPSLNYVYTQQTWGEGGWYQRRPCENNSFETVQTTIISWEIHMPAMNLINLTKSNYI